MGLVWSILFPLGAVIVRFLNTQPVGKHRLVQLSALVMLLIAVGIGFYLGQGHQFTLFRESVG